MTWKLIAEAVGVAKGGAVRNALASVWSALGLDRLAERSPARQGVAFTVAFVALAGKMAKADGVAVNVEAEAFERCFHVAPEERANIKRVFDLAKQDVAGYETYAEQVARFLKDEPELLRDVFESLFHVASADGVLHHAEEQYLRTVASKFGLSDTDYASIRRLFVRDVDSPYEVLGLSPDATDEEVKARHRALVLAHHPDRLAAHGVPEEFRSTAGRELAAINAAYDAIRKERGAGGRT